MTFPFFVLLLVHYIQFTSGAEVVVWRWSFETNESDSWQIQNKHKPFERISYLNSTVPAQDGDWAITGNGDGNELLLPQVAYYGGNIKLTFYAYALQPVTLLVQFLQLNLILIKETNISVTKDWNQYAVSLGSNQYKGSSAFLVSLMYSGENSIYLDSVSILIDDSIISCSSITSSNHCGFETAVSGSSGWSFASTSASWITLPAYTYLKRDFLYLGGLLKGAMNFRGSAIGSSVIIEISVNQTSYQQQIRSGYTDFDLTASTQYTVGKTYTILITFVTTAIKAQLNSISMYVAGNCSECHSALNCNKLPNGVTCVCRQNSCSGSHTQCIVSKTDKSINPCSCMSGYTADFSGNCVDVNECDSNPCSWSNGVCTNTNGSYSCSCSSGWMLGPNNASCVDVDECNSTTPLCSWSNGVCVNTNGIYSCSCSDGWMLGEDNASCVDVNECNSKPCSWSNGVCTNTNGSYSCSCSSGWMLGPNNASCVGKCGECEGKNKRCVEKSATEAVCVNINSSSNSLVNITALTVLSICQYFIFCA